ncbi:DUF6376 family protein [Paenibacillus montanisoli]|uniref:Uncharacterized protein n=1 Tax=Paenibacillus montanisoli TaxID=2081970 RepID=A0A328TZ32_9BACL|nr:DUF6376 family protein [Paenibacillus montanisoli]RAP75749.1 hypothetical protein DL346_09875 [Paenibacillus montanisoli]
MFRKLLIVLGVLVVILGGTFLYFKDTIMGTVQFAKQTKETVSTVNAVNEKMPALIQKAKENQKKGTDSEVKPDKSAEAEIKQELITVKQEMKKLVETEPPAKLKSMHGKLAAHSDEANLKIDEYIRQIDNGTFNPEEFQALYEQMKDSPEFKEAEKYLNLLR